MTTGSAETEEARLFSAWVVRRPLGPRDPGAVVLHENSWTGLASVAWGFTVTLRK